MLWQSPEGRIYLCDRRGHTTDLDASLHGDR